MQSNPFLLSSRLVDFTTPPISKAPFFFSVLILILNNRIPPRRPVCQRGVSAFLQPCFVCS